MLGTRGSRSSIVSDPTPGTAFAFLSHTECSVIKEISFDEKKKRRATPHIIYDTGEIMVQGGISWARSPRYCRARASEARF